MKFRKLTWIILLVVLSLALAACGGDDKDGGGGGDVNLSQTLTATVEGFGSYSIKYAEGWVGNSAEDSITVASSQAVLDKMDASDPTTTVEKGEAASAVMVFPTEMIGFLGIEGTEPGDVAGGFINMMASESEGTEANLSDPETFDAGGKPAGLVSGTITEEGRTMGAIIVAVDTGSGGMGIIMVITHEDEVDDYKDMAKAMAGTFEYTPEG